MVRSGYTVLSSVLGKAGIKRNKVSGKGKLSKNKQTNKNLECAQESLFSLNVFLPKVFLVGPVFLFVQCRKNYEPKFKFLTCDKVMKNVQTEGHGRHAD